MGESTAGQMFRQDGLVLRRGPRPRTDLLEFVDEPRLRDLRVVGHLGTKPIAIREPEETAQPQVRISRDGAPTGDDLADALCGHADLLREPVPRYAHGQQELLKQWLAGSHRCKCLRHHHHLLVVVHDLNVLGAGGSPTEADAVLVVDADAVLTVAVPLERLEPIPRRDP